MSKEIFYKKEYIYIYIYTVYIYSFHIILNLLEQKHFGSYKDNFLFLCIDTEKQTVSFVNIYYKQQPIQR